MRQERKAAARNSSTSPSSSGLAGGADDVTVVVAGERPSESAREAQRVVQERREAAHVAAIHSNEYASAWSTNLARANALVMPNGEGRRSEEAKAAAAAAAEQITNPSFVCGFRGFPGGRASLSSPSR